MLPPGECEYLCSAACRLARIGGETARRLIGCVAIARKPDDTPVTDADHRAQAAILNVISEEFPSHAVLVEEHIVEPRRHAMLSDSDFCWIVDPIDGTRNFARGLGMYATSVAVLHRGVPVAGAIFDASTSRVFSASLGGGAYLDDQPIRVRSAISTEDAFVLISSFRRVTMPEPVALWMKRFLFRNVGSLCLHLAWVAAGYADAAFSLECKLWDLAAGALIVTEAGGIATDAAGRALWPAKADAFSAQDIPMLVGSPPMHAELLRSLAK